MKVCKAWLMSIYFRGKVMRSSAATRSNFLHLSIVRKHQMLRSDPEITMVLKSAESSSAMRQSTEEVRIGGWLVSIYKAISSYDVDDPAFDDYESVITSAKTAELLSSIRSLGTVDHQKFEVRSLSEIFPP